MPILPIVMVFASYGVFELIGSTRQFYKKLALAVFLMLTAGYYVYFPILLLNQFQRNTPKSAAYLWVQKNVPELSWKLVYTEEHETNIRARQRKLYLKRLKSRVYIEKLINEKGGWRRGSAPS